MNLKTKREYLAIVRERYQKCSTKLEKSTLISEVMGNLSMARKSVIRSINHRPPRYRKPRTGRAEVYGFDLIRPLTTLWKVAGCPCSKRLKPQVGELINHLKRFDEITLYGDQEEKLLAMSAFTMDRLLVDARHLPLNSLGLSGTKRSPLLKTLIPIRTGFEDVHEPGHVEMDCVLHCGESLVGHYAETLNLLDIHTHWNEKIIFFRKTKTKVIGGVHVLRNQFPFPLKSLDFDNGREFVNWELHGYCQREHLDFTRSRSYHKNDQAHIEGKNFQSIRRLIGYDRIVDEKIIALIQDIYQHEHRLLTNFFYTTMKLKTKRRVNGKAIKSYQVAKTPYQRVLESPRISKQIKVDLTAEYLSLNPAELQRNLHTKLNKIQVLISNSRISGNGLQITPFR